MQKVKILLLVLALLLVGCFKQPNNKDASNKAKKPIISLNSYELFEGGFATNNILAVLVARDLLWIGTDHGLYTFNLKTKEKYDSYLDGEVILDLIASDKGTIFAAVKNKGLHYLPSLDNQFYEAQGGKPRKLLLEPNTENVYCATADGIGYFADSVYSKIEIPKISEYASMANDINSLVFDKNGVLWIGTQFGVYRKQANNYQFLYGNYQIVQGLTIINHKGNSPLSGNLIYAISLADDGSILFSTNGGLSILKDPENYQVNTNWQSFTGDHSISVMENGSIVEKPRKGNSPLSTNFINIAKSFNELTFIGTSNGLFLLENQNFKHYDLDKNLAGDTIHDLYYQKDLLQDNLYVATNGGLSIFTINRELE